MGNGTAAPRLGRYELLERIGSGGMSTIYLARQALSAVERLVVLKVVKVDAEVTLIKDLLLEEARVAAGFSHPNIAQLYELEETPTVQLLSMEFVDGCTVSELARARKREGDRLPVGFCVAMGRDVARALHHAHTFVDARGRARPTVHRDVNGRNVMLTFGGVTKLLDFGIARCLTSPGKTATGFAKGTAGHMAPEQIRGEAVDGRTDVFALGVLLHECLTGERLFHRRSEDATFRAPLDAVAAPPSKRNPAVPPELDEVVLRALEKSPARRFATCLEFARALEAAVEPWAPEECAALVTRQFQPRRDERRRRLRGDETSSTEPLALALAPLPLEPLPLGDAHVPPPRTSPARPGLLAPAAPAPWDEITDTGDGGNALVPLPPPPPAPSSASLPPVSTALPSGLLPLPSRPPVAGRPLAAAPSPRRAPAPPAAPAPRPRPVGAVVVSVVVLLGLSLLSAASCAG